MFRGLFGSLFDCKPSYEPPKQLNATLIMPDNLTPEQRQRATEAFNEKCRVMMMTDEQIIEEQRNK
jgi:hypothetical protein